MEQTNTHAPGNSTLDRRVDSSRWRADAEAADEQARQRAAQARREEEQQLQQRESAQPQAAQAETDPLWQRWWGAGPTLAFSYSPLRRWRRPTR